MINYLGESVFYDPGNSPINNPLWEKVSRINQKWQMFINPLINYMNEDCPNQLTRKQRWQSLVNRFETKSFYQAIQETGWWSNDEIRLFATIGFGTGGFGSLFRISFIEILRVQINGWATNQELIVGGAQLLTDNFWHHQRDCRHFGLASVADINNNNWRGAVTAISLNGDQIRITDHRNHNCDYFAAIITCPLPIIEMKINIEDRIFSQKTWHAIREFHYNTSTKIFVRTDKAFWIDNPELLACTITDRETRGTYLFDFPNTESGVICLSYTWGDDALKFNFLDESQQIEKSLQVLEKIYGNQLIRKHLQEHVTISWDNKHDYGGAFSLAYPGQYSDQLALFNEGKNINSQSNVFLAGEAISWSGGWVEGALNTGINAAQSVIAQLE